MSRAACAIAVAGALVLGVGLGRRDFWEPDEPRHGAIAEEMRALRHGPAQLVVPRLNGEVYSQKPPLYYWLAALAGAPRGHVSEAAARLPSAVAGLGTALVVLRLGNAALGAPAGVVGAALLLSLPAFVDAARQARPDPLLAFFVTCAVALVWRLDRGIGGATWNRRALHLVVGLGALAKGPVAALLPLLGALVYLAWERRLRDARKLVSRDAALFSAAPALGWLAAAWLSTPDGFLREAVVENVLVRFLGGAHEQSLSYYARRLPVAFLPWTLLWPFAAWRIAAAFRAGADPERARGLRFLIAFVGAGLAFFTLSAGKRGIYLLPLYPALALLSAEAFRGLGHAAARGAAALASGRMGLRDGLGLGAAASALFAAVGTAFGLPPTALGPGVVIVAAASLVPSERFLPVNAWLARGLALVVACEAAVFAFVLPRFDLDRSVRGAASAAAAFAPEGSAIGLVRNGSLAGGIAYYSGRPVVEIGSTRGLERFLEAGGRSLVLEQPQLGTVAAVAGAEVVFRQELDENEILVVRVAAAGADAGDRGARLGVRAPLEH
jgi:4-amino-4-deoxy-L-arabinose transferase-like glycosyltransferase